MSCPVQFGQQRRSWPPRPLVVVVGVAVHVRADLLRLLVRDLALALDLFVEDR